MASTQGTAIIWGCSATNLTGFSAAVSGAYTITGEDYAKESDIAEIRDRSGELKTMYFYNGRVTLSLKAFPSGSSASATALPVIGEKVAVASASDSNISGDWIATAVSKTRSNEGHVEFDLQLVAPDSLTPS